MYQQQLLIFTRYPERGKTKTRLIPLLGEQGAADLQRQMTEYTLDKAKRLCSQFPISLDVYFTGAEEEKMRTWLVEDLTYQQQGEGDLGTRLKRALREAFTQRKERVVIIGIDCPELTEKISVTAFQSLTEKELVLGPARDGGYYLIGLNRYCGELFESIDWGSELVFNQTCAIASKLGLDWRELPLLSDVDRPEDYGLWLQQREKI